MPSIIRIPLLAMLLCGAGPLAAATWTPETDAIAPAIQPQLLVHTLVGGPGDQRFIAVRAKAGMLQAVDGCGLGVTVKLQEDGTPKVTVGGNRAGISSKDPTPFLSGNGQVGPISFGFKQVHPILQQPWAKGPGWTLWDFSHAQAKQRELMADSRIRAGLQIPNGNVLLVGWCDGGNTVLHRDPRDIDKKSPYMRYGFGGGRGASNLYTEVTPKGEVLRQAFMGVGTGRILWDPWGRLYACGTNLCKGGKAPFDTPSSGSLVVFDREWTQALLDARLGGVGGSYKDNSWDAMELDAENGLLILGGWAKGAIEKPVAGVQEKHGGDKDAMIAVIRLWSPEDYRKSVEAGKAPAPASPAKK